jgi:hypothetical protein
MTNPRSSFTAKVLATLLGFACDCSSAASPPVAGNAPPRAEAVRLRRVEVVDEALFSRRAEVVSMLIPVDWSFEGGFALDINVFRWCPENAFTGRFQAQSPDGSIGIAAFPALQTLHFQNPLLAEDARRRAQMGQGFCQMRPPLGIGQFVEQVLVPVFRPGARVLRVEPAAVLQQNIRRQLGALQLPSNLRVNGDAAEVVIGYALNGRDVEEHIYVIGGWRAESTGGGTAVPDVIYSVYTPVIGLRVPAGQFKRHQRQFANIIATMRGDARFHAAVAESVQQQRASIFNNFIGEIRATSAIWRAAWESAGSAARQKEAATAQRQTRDVAGAWSDTVLDVQNYTDTNGETVQLSGGYSHVFSNRNGEYIQTNDPSYDPAVATGERWEAIRAIPR